MPRPAGPPPLVGPVTPLRRPGARAAGRVCPAGPGPLPERPTAPGAGPTVVPGRPVARAAGSGVPGAGPMARAAMAVVPARRTACLPGSVRPPVPVTRLVAGPVVSPGRLAGLPTTGAVRGVGPRTRAGAPAGPLRRPAGLAGRVAPLRRPGARAAGRVCPAGPGPLPGRPTAPGAGPTVVPGRPTAPGAGPVARAAGLAVPGAGPMGLRVGSVRSTGLLTRLVAGPVVSPGRPAGLPTTGAVRGVGRAVRLVGPRTRAGAPADPPRRPAGPMAVATTAVLRVVGPVRLGE